MPQKRPHRADLPGVWNPNELPWMRQKGESWQAYEAFAIYRDLGGARNHVKVAEKLGKNISLIRRWASKWMWTDRAATFEANEDFERMVRMREERMEMFKKDIEIAKDIKLKVIRYLNQMDHKKLTPNQAAKLLEVAMKVHTQALGGVKEGADGEGERLAPQTDALEIALEQAMEENPELKGAAAKLVAVIRGAGGGS